MAGWAPIWIPRPPGTITRFNLLDIFDWMSPQMFEATLQSVLRAAAPGAIMIYRSGSYRLDPPPSILEHVDQHPELAQRLLAIDRSATYGSFYVLSLKDGHNHDQLGQARTGDAVTGSLATRIDLPST